MKAFLQGCSRALGIVAGFLPIAMSFGAISVQAGLPATAAVGMSAWLFAGAAQFAAVEAVRQGLSGWSILLTVFIINLRHIPMSLAAQKLYGKFGRWQQWLLAQGMIDETFALELCDRAHPFPYYLGIHLSCWGAWVVGTALGCWVGLQLPERWLQFALPALFICLLCSGLQGHWNRDAAVAIAVGIAFTLIAQPLGATGLLLAIVAIALVVSRLPGLQTLGEDRP
ncbi:AzlC family ABC transporter permease [Nodosilinea sp. E11]|uniref:AzlC family ABC transporter permease n=1 Tax=Nodosilinea sp. E11 TaxID=3037479 RepID=UPI0029348858|nr:AzlC family ABC transporter permease [Nodosilinea sp. E11]WOD40540.1 AzlC family ABC transporter permease [Nodosilinea sp. E11]